MHQNAFHLCNSYIKWHAVNVFNLSVSITNYKQFGLRVICLDNLQSYTKKDYKPSPQDITDRNLKQKRFGMMNIFFQL